MSWLWQPLLPGAARLLAAGGVIEELVGTSTGAATVTGVLHRRRDFVGSATGAAIVTGVLDEIAGPGAAQARAADDRPARRRRDRQASEIYWTARQREANEEAERKRLAALEEAEEALREAERAKKADAKRAAVRRVFQALKRAATSEHAERSAQAAEQVALEAVKAKATADQRDAYLAALDQLNAEIDSIGAEIARLYARRRQEEQFLLQRWFAA